jgi:hypothetical protein
MGRWPRILDISRRTVIHTKHLQTDVVEENAVRPFGSISVLSDRIKKGRGKSDGYND